MGTPCSVFCHVQATAESGSYFFAAAAAGERLGDMPPEKKYVPAPRSLAWLSRRSLLIYLVHQPVLFALAALLQHAAQGT